MNCREFEDSIVALVRDADLDERIRIPVLVHAEECAPCAARLADQRALSAWLQLAASDDRQAPAHIESTLLAAYRRHYPPAVRHILPQPAKGIIRYRAIAASLLVAFLGFAAMLLLRIREPETAATVIPAPQQSPQTIEIATDFFALMPGAGLNTLESGQIVRVRLPRNALNSYGLPVHRDRMDEPVTAQVLIGQDGVARAIRFLSEQDAFYTQTGQPLGRQIRPE